MNKAASTSKSLLKFFFLVFAISVPFWILGALTKQLSEILPINLPVSALMFVCPILIALILAHRENKSSGIKELLGRTFDYKKTENKIWYIPIVFFMPAVLFLSYWLMRLLQLPLPQPNIPFGAMPIFFIVFFIGAICEEIGWTGYATDQLQKQMSALKASLILGSIWAIWHVIPWYQGHPDFEWVAWQCAATITMRIIMIWLYNNTGKSVFSAILFHAMINVSEYMFPNYGSHFNPFITFVIIALAALIVIFLWQPDTLAQYRYTLLPSYIKKNESK